MPLQALPEDKLAALPPVLKHGDVALIESNGDGTLKQVTLMLFVAASPEVVHGVIAKPLDYKKFVPNVSRSTWEPRPDGTYLYSWKLELPVSSFENSLVYKFTGQTIEVFSPREEDDATYRYHLVPAAGGTVLVQYGYTDVKHSNKFVRSFVKRMPVTEHGLALAAQMMLMSAVKREAEKRGGGLAPLKPAGQGPGFGFLLERGQVAVMRSLPDGRLGDVSVIDHVYAPIAKVKAALREPGNWSQYVPGVYESQKRFDGTVRIDFAIPLVTWSTVWAFREQGNAVEAMGVEGDLRGAQVRWDLTERGPADVLVVYRVRQQLWQSSVVYRKLIEHDHSLEHGLNVAFSLVYLRAIRGRAEGWKQ